MQSQVQKKAWIFSLKIGEKGRTFATFARRSGPEKKHQREHVASDPLLFSKAHIGSPLSRVANGEWLAMTIRTQCAKTDLTSVPQWLTEIVSIFLSNNGAARQTQSWFPEREALPGARGARGGEFEESRPLQG
jgi:hypothetical protein